MPNWPLVTDLEAETISTLFGLIVNTLPMCLIDSKV